MASQVELTTVQAAPRAATAWLELAGSVALAVTLLALAARIAVPLPGTPVPVTFQDLTVLAVGLALGPRRGALAVGTYVLLGALGAPVFSNGAGGLGWLMGPTGGYLLAFPVSAAVIGLAGASRRLLPMLGGLAAAHAATFSGGLLQLALVTGMDAGDAVAAGLLPFIPGIAIKSALLIAGWAAWLKLSGAEGTGED